MDYDFNRLLADAARELARQPSVVTTLERVVGLCTESLSGCDHAGISVVEDGEIRTLAATDRAIHTLDRLQADLGEGPCLEALTNHEAVICHDLRDDSRWPVWSTRAGDAAGVRSLMSFCLFSSGGSAGSLTLYSRSGNGFDPEDLLEAQVMAAHAAVALATQFKEHQLHQALETRTVIGQATGILIERFGLTADQAFAVMRRVSQNHNIKLHVLAEHLVQTGVLLDPSRGDADSSTPAADGPIPGASPADGQHDRHHDEPYDGLEEPRVDGIAAAPAETAQTEDQAPA